MATSALTVLEPKSLIRPTHWSKEVENAYRFQLAGYRDELEYKRIRQVAEIDVWPDSGFVKKLQRRKDGFFYYFDKLRECPDKEMNFEPSAPVANPIEQSGTDYLQRHHIPDLFHNLSASLVYNKPDDPKAFIIDYLEQLKKARATGLAFPTLVQDTDLTSVFRMLDPVGYGYITYSQYASTMEALGITNYNKTPPGKDKDQISSETFCHEAKARLNELNATFLVQ